MKREPLEPLIPLEDLKKVVGGLIAVPKPEKPGSDSTKPGPEKPGSNAS
jgi:hypothetical protein